MRVLHAAYSSVPSIGIIRQMEEEQKSAHQLGIPWTTRLFLPAGTPSPIAVTSSVNPKNRLAFKKEYYRWLEQEASKADIVLLRYASHDPWQYRFIKKLSQKVFLVHHTLEIPELRRSHNKLAPLKAFIEAQLGPLSIKAAKGIIGVTSEIVQYELKRAKINDKFSAVYPNGITYEGFSLPNYLRSKVPELLFIASQFSPWHGLDLLIKSVTTSNIEVKIHLVGHLDKTLQRAIANDNRFIAHGVVSESYISQLLPKCWLGLASFGFERLKMQEACTLKVREYLRAGLAVYAGYKDVFETSDYYFKTGPCNIESIIDYAYEMVQIDPQIISEEARKKIEKKILISHLYQKMTQYWHNEY